MTDFVNETTGCLLLMRKLLLSDEMCILIICPTNGLYSSTLLNKTNTPLAQLLTFAVREME